MNNKSAMEQVSDRIVISSLTLKTKWVISDRFRCRSDQSVSRLMYQVRGT